MMLRIAQWLAVAVTVAGLFFVSPASAQQSAGIEGLREVQLGSAQLERGAPFPDWLEKALPIPTSNDTAPYVILLADTQFIAADKPAYYSHRAFKVNNASALTELGKYSVEFNPAYQRVLLHTLRVWRAGQPSDRLASTRITFLQRETGLENGVYSGEVSASMLIPDLRVGDTLEIAMTLEGANPVLGGKFGDWAIWDSINPTEHRRIVLRHPAQRNIQWRLIGDAIGPAAQPQITTEGSWRKLMWEGRQMPRVEIEQQIPAFYMPLRMLQFSEFQNWDEVVEWAGALFRSSGPTPELASIAASLTKGKVNDAEKTAAALIWVQNEIRYFSLSLGESSHRPAPPAETLKRRFGDCKDKSVLLVELLRQMGIQAQPVLISSKLNRRMTRFLPGPLPFDHVIVRAEVNGKPYFLDSTRLGQAGKIDAMGQSWAKAEVLVIQPGGKFTTVPAGALSNGSSDLLDEKIRLARFEDDAEVTVTQTWTGLHAEGRRVAFADVPAKRLAEYFLEPYERSYPGVQHATAHVLADDRENNRLTLTMTLKAPKIAINSGGDWGVRYGPSNMRGMLPTPPSPTRTQPIAISGNLLTRYTVEIEFPQEVSAINDPFSRLIRDDAFEYQVTKSFRGNRAVTTLELRNRGDEIDARRVPGYMAKVRDVVDADRGIYIARKSFIKGAESQALSMQATIEKRLQERIDQLTKALETGRLSGEDLVEAHCERAESLVDIGRAADGLADAQAALKAGPNMARAHACRGNVHFGMGEFAKAVADYSQAIIRDPEESGTFYRRGHARYYLGLLPAAEQDFAKAGKPHPGGEDSVLYAALWRSWTQKHLRMAPTDDQAKLAGADPRGTWPRPALAMLHGLISVDDMLKTIDAKKGDEKEMALAEAYFYAGQWHLAQGDKAKAADYFRKTRKQGVIVYVEHVSAGLELARIESAAK